MSGTPNHATETPLAGPSVETLLGHAGWIRALARNLARDEHAADDLVQQT